MLFILFTSLAVSVLVAKLYIPYALVNWDESVFLYWAYTIFQSIKNGNLTAFWQNTLNQFGYGPLQSWIIALSLLPFGFSIKNARYSGLFPFVLSALFVYQICLLLCEKKKTIIGFIAVFLFLSSPLVLLFSGLAMKETTGMCFVLAVFWMYFFARKKRGALYFSGVSFLLICLFLTKYFYAVLAVTIISFESAFSVISLLLSKSSLKLRRRSEIGRELYSLFFLYGPFLFFTYLWIFTPDNKMLDFYKIFFSGVKDLTYGFSNTWAYRLFYIRAITHMYAFSIPLGFFLLFSLLYSVSWLKDFKIRMLWIYVVLNILVGSINTNNMTERYIITSMPFLFILGALSLVSIISKLKPYLKDKLVLAISAVIVSILTIRMSLDLVRLPSYVYAVGGFTFKTPAFNQPDFKELWFDYDTSKWSSRLPHQSAEKPSSVLGYIVSKIDLSKPIEIVGRANELAPDYFHLIFAMHRKKGDYPILPYSSYKITIEILPTSRFYTRDYKMKNEWLNYYVKKVEKDPSIELYDKKIFKDLGVMIGIYVPKE